MTTSQELLKYAHERVATKEVDREYRTVVLNAASFVKSSGLVQAVAFFNSKADKPQFKRLLGDLRSMPGVGDGAANDDEFLKQISNASTIAYMRKTQRALQGLVMLKRMVEAYTPEEVRKSAEGA
jgi:CRISPR/Cas system CMR-associated protein Cmr5 small subunit